jgi:hypothetical protein
MQIKASQSIAFCFCTADPASGAGLDPTTPGTATTGKLYINGVQDAATVTLADDAAASDGITKVSYTVPATVSQGDSVQCIITATVGGVAASSVVRDDYVVTRYASEVYTAVGSPMQDTARPAGDYPTALTYNAHGDIATVTWNSAKVWTYVYDASYNLTGVTEA